MTSGPFGRHLWKAGVLALVMGVCPAGPARAQQNVDAAVKKLMAANGFFQRGLFKPAAREFADFLATYPRHAEATTARYGLAVCHYRLNEYVEAANLCQEVLKDAKFKPRDEALAVLGPCRLATRAYARALAAGPGAVPAGQEGEVAGRLPGVPEAISQERAASGGGVLPGPVAGGAGAPRQRRRHAGPTAQGLPQQSL